MAILKRMTDEELKNFQHVGFIFGFVPVYIGNLNSDCPLVEVRNWYPDWLLDVGHFLFDTFCPNSEGFVITVTGDIKHKA